MQRLERKYDELRVSSSQALAAPLLADAALLARRASEEAVRRVEERQREMASSQQRTEERVKELQHELKLERHRRKLLQACAVMCNDVCLERFSVINARLFRLTIILPQLGV